jgi:hypothetical protein
MVGVPIWLGVRQSVTEVARNMQKAGVIRYRRGELQILDRKKLEAMACECYGGMKRLYDLLARVAL